ncbi:MAG: hypothetical protein DLM63_02755, partial [Solirubrobacterales bacterium]
MPATFVVAGTRARPPVITVPAGIPVELTVASGDGRSHRAQLLVAGAPELVVAAGGRASERIAAPPANRYVLLVDGQAAGALVV